MAYIDVRPARPEDREAVLAFCRNTWEWGDYIDQTWDEWLRNPAGRLFVATVEERPAGIVHLDMLTTIDAWLEGLRVDPQYRQQGLARALYEALLSRLCSAARNMHARRLLVRPKNPSRPARPPHGSNCPNTSR